MLTTRSRTPHNKGKRRIKKLFGGYYYEDPNQLRKDRISTLVAFITFVFVLPSLFSLAGMLVNQEIEQELLSPYVSTTKIEAKEVVEASPEPSPTPTTLPEETTDEIKQLLKIMFREDHEVAWAVGMSESGMGSEKTLMVRAGNYEWSHEGYKGECSVGLFMINLAEDGCHGKWIHAGKVPGKTMEEKIAWLKIPENNITIAKYIYEHAGQSFGAWSGYTGDGYKKFLKGN